MPETSILSTVTSITTPLALIAFIVAIGLFAFRSHLDAKGKRIERARPEDLPQILRDEDFPFTPDMENLDPKDQKDLVHAQIDARTKRILIQAVLVFLLAVLLAIVAYFFREQSFLNEEIKPNPGPPEVVIDSRKLSSSTEFVYPDRVVRLKGVITTDGHALTIKAKTLVADDAEIVAFDAPKAGSGSSGAPGNQGVDATGAGQKGGDGERGGDGLSGGRGRTPGNVLLASTDLRGSLRVVLSGQSGGAGGDGGGGGRGGNGARGEASQPGVFDCAKGPGYGGAGGKGGNGGNAGDGGDGGNGARVSVDVPGRLDGSIKITTLGSAGGSGGKPGPAGLAGAGGPEGALHGTCKSAGRVGAAGAPGAPGKPGSEGKPGADGTISIRTAGVERETAGSAALP